LQAPSHKVNKLNGSLSNEDAQTSQMQELDIVTNMLRAMQDLPPESRQRVIDTVARFFDLRVDHGARAGAIRPSDAFTPPDDLPQTLPQFSEDRSITPKQFMFQKQRKPTWKRLRALHTI
jgi:hypothetical protein